MHFSKTPLEWKGIAWNSVRMEIPASWEITGIDHAYLRFSDSTGPVLELKWSPAPPDYSTQRGIARIKKKQGLRKSWQIRETALPLSWHRNDAVLPVTETTSSAFSWQTDAENGVGLLCHIPAAACAALLCFYPSVTPAVQEACIHKSGFHQDSDTVLWSLFDIRAETPTDFHLSNFHFFTGEFKLTFTRRKCQLTLWRWSPASALINQGGLDGFARKQFRLSSQFDGLTPIEINGWQGLKWQKVPQASGGLYSFFNRIFPKKTEAGLIWQQTDQNRLLAVHMESGKEEDWEIIRSVSRQFQCQ